MIMTSPSGPPFPAATMTGNSRERLEIHNIEVDQATAGRHLCGNLHLPSGRVCLLPERHRGGCRFTSRPARDSRP
jgi:hypothetical protein